MTYLEFLWKFRKIVSWYAPDKNFLPIIFSIKSFNIKLFYIEYYQFKYFIDEYFKFETTGHLKFKYFKFEVINKNIITNLNILNLKDCKDRVVGSYRFYFKFQ